jgi:hypothetical protein
LVEKLRIGALNVRGCNEVKLEKVKELMDQFDVLVLTEAKGWKEEWSTPIF